ncbi:MAG: hypothetical protein AB7F88_00565 [Pyrinomonadaceae bacterium]
MDTRGFSERLSKSIEYLGFKARSHNAIVAHEYIESVLSVQRKYALYQEMFPDEWRCSKASLYKRGYYARYSERINELFDLVNLKCFPLLEYVYDDPECELDRFAIAPLNSDLCCQEIDLESANISYSAGLIFYLPDEAWDFLSHRFKLSAADFPEIAEGPHPNVWKSDSNSPLGELIKLLDHSTGNVWLDTCYCQYADWYEWNRETIEELTSEYEAACSLFAGLKIIDEMIEADPKKMLRALIDFWNNGRLPNDTRLRSDKRRK